MFQRTSDSRHYPFDLPSGWVWTTLGELFTLQAGKNISAKEISIVQNKQNNYPCFGGNGIRGYVTSFNISGSHPIIGRQGALCGNINLATNEFYATEHAVVVDFYCETDLMWCYYTLKALNLNQYATATAQPGLAVKVINEAFIPLPPYKEQRKISNAISHWFSLIDDVNSSKVQLKNAISQVKSKILNLAIHGKLVSQDPADEPASELLKRVNPSAEITCDNEQYGNMPQNWVTIKLGGVGKWKAGATPSRTISEYYGGTIPWLKTGDLNDGFITKIPESITQKALDETSVYLNPTDSVLIAMYGATIGRVGILTFPATTNQACCACSGYFVNKMYLFYFLIANRSTFLALGGGGAQPNISKEKIVNLSFPLPPLAEQKRIVAKIEELFAQLDAIENSLQA